MKICLVSYHCCPFSLIGRDGVGGMSVYIKEIGKSLLRFPDVQVDIFTRAHDSRFRGVKTIIPGLRVIHLPAGPLSRLSRLQHYSYISEFSQRLMDFMKSQDFSYDVLYTHYWLSGLTGEWIINRMSIPMVHTYHSVGFLQKQARGNGESRLRMDAERRIALIADKIITSNHEGKRKLQSEYDLGSDQIQVVYPGVNADLFRPSDAGEIKLPLKLDSKEKLLLYVGRIEPIKGLHLIAEALDFLRCEDREVFQTIRVAVIGGGRRETDFLNNKEMLRIRDYLKSRNLSDKVLWLGSKKQEELRHFYSISTALVVPSLYESFGLVVVESLACGIPVLVSQVGKMRDLIVEGKSGLSFPPNDSIALAKSISRLVRTRSDFWGVEQIRSYVTGKYTWDQAGEEIFQAFKNLEPRKDQVTTIPQPGESPRQV